jgi:4'-phosphopantetheinyl transferase
VDTAPASLQRSNVVLLSLLDAGDDGFWHLLPLAQQLLTPQERVEFGRVRSASVRGRRIACRAWLRLLLGEALGMPPQAVALSRERHGRLELVDGPRGIFNVSHSDGVAAIALLQQPWATSPLPRIGIDVETPGRRWTPELAQALYSDSELAWLNGRSVDQRDDGFLLLWTLREAVLKADGRGLSMDLRQIRFRPHAEPEHARSGGRGIDVEESALIDPERWCCWTHREGRLVCSLALHGYGCKAPLGVDIERFDARAATARMEDAVRGTCH